MAKTKTLSVEEHATFVVLVQESDSMNRVATKMSIKVLCPGN